MATWHQKHFFHVLDVETTGLSAGHKNTGLLQIFASKLPPYVASPFHPTTLVKPRTGYTDPVSGVHIPFAYNYEKGQHVLSQAMKLGQESEEESARRFFASAEEELSRKKRFLLTGWNVKYDTGVLTEIANRYPSLHGYKDFFQRKGVKVFGLEQSFFELALGYGQDNPEFAERYLRMGPSTPITKTTGPGMLARNVEEMQWVPGWKVENIAGAAGGMERLLGPKLSGAAGYHEAVTDVKVEQTLFERLRTARKNLQRGHSWEEALGSAQLLPEGETAETFFSKIYANPWAEKVAAQAERGAKVLPKKMSGIGKGLSLALVFAGAATAAWAIASSKRSDRQTQITGLSDTGMAADSRHKLTDFGSGWQGQDNSHTLRLASLLVGGAAVLGAHKFALENWSGYAEGIYQFAKKIETRSPGAIFGTFRFSERMSSYLPEEVSFKAEQLVRGSELTEMGKHIQRLIGVSALDKRFAKEGMRFTRTSASSPYLSLVGGRGESIRFAQRGRLTGSAASFGGPLKEQVFPRTLTTEGPLAEMWEMFQNLRGSQRPGTPLTKGQAFKQQAGGEFRFFEPLYGRKPGFVGGVESAYRTGQRALFEAAERPLRLLSDIGMGLPKGSYNKLFHIPFHGEGGMLNALMLKRVLPAYLAITAARYINYQLDNKPAEKLAEIPLKAHLAWARATDTIPGLRAITDKYEEIVPGPQYGPAAIPIGAGAIGAGIHWFNIARGAEEFQVHAARAAASRKAFWKGFGIGVLIAAPFIPGMIGSRKTEDELQRIYSGEEEVPVRAGRWWDVGSTPFSGGRIKYFRPHWYQLMKSKAEMVSTYGSEDAYWEHHPLLHPFKYIKDPYWLERANYASRPYPITSPAFSNVPLIGPLLAATIGRIVKPPQRMHEGEWDINNYTLYSPRLEPNMELGGLAPSKPREEFGFKDVTTREALAFAEYTGLPGFIATTLYGQAGPQGTPGKDVILQGSRQMTNLARQYYQRELGAVSGFNPSGTGGMPFGYSEPLRRFIQPDKLGSQANEIPNTMPRWLPGEDYMINFRTGDPFAKIPEGGARLPGRGYATLHPELRGLKPEEYPDITRYKILADVAPWSKEYMIYRSKVRAQAQKDARLGIEFARTEDQVRQMKESTIQTQQRRFTAPIEQLQGTITKATPEGIELEQYPGRKFMLSSLGMSAADLSALTLGQENELTRSQSAKSVTEKQAALEEYLTGQIGMQATLVVPKGTEQHAAEARAVLFVDNVNINKEIIDKGLGQFRKDYGGAEAQAMYSSTQVALGKYAETLSFTGEGGPLRFVPTPFHTKYWNERTALSLYQEQEVYGARMRRWQHPFRDMIAPWARGAYRRFTGGVLVPEQVEQRRLMDSLVDQLEYLRADIQASAHPGQKGRYTSQGKRTNIGANLFGNPQFISQTLPRREKLYFPAFLQETDPEKRQQILESVSPELGRALTAQWVKTDAMLARLAGKQVPAIEEGGVLYTEEGLKEYEQAKTDLSYSDYIRSKQIAETFGKLGFDIPGPGSPLWEQGIDYEDVKLKIIQNEGYDYHDFNIYDDRAALLWRKPYIDGAVRELVSSGSQPTERIRQTVERIILEGQDKNPQVVASGGPNKVGGSNVSITVDTEGDKEVMRDIRRNEEEYREETTS